MISIAENQTKYKTPTSREEILYPFALDENDNLIHATLANRAHYYRCPGCLRRLVPHKGILRQDHFAHYDPAAHCSLETYIHHTAKHKLADKIRNSSPLFLRNCTCGEQHPVTFSTKDKNVIVEYFYHGLRIDVGVSNPDGSLLLALEVVYAHYSEANKIELFLKNKIYWAELSASEIISSPNTLFRPILNRYCLPPFRYSDYHRFGSSAYITNIATVAR